MKSPLPSLLLTVFLAGCASVVNVTPPQQNIGMIKSEVDAKAVQSLVSGQRALTADLYKKLLEDDDAKDKNLFISPLSISTAFGLAYAGAKGDTEREIAHTLHYNLPEEDLHKAMGNTLGLIQNDSTGQLFQTANALFTDKQTILEKSYLDTVGKHYGAKDTRVDFRYNSDRAVDEINEWVSKRTKGLIPETFTYEQIKEDTRNVLVNTAYLKANWARSFSESQTKIDIFHGSNGDQNVPIMQQEGEFRYIKTSSYSAIDLPYQGREMSMSIVLPKRRKGLKSLDRKLTAEFFDKLFTRLSTAETYKVDLRLPKIDISDDYKLKNPLKEMGMKIPFSDFADFSGRVPHHVPLESGRSQLLTKLNEVIHKTVLKVDEKGTEAAAVTAIDEIIVVGARLNQKSAKFHADHPFLLIIRHKRTNAILFIGRIVSPLDK